MVSHIELLPDWNVHHIWWERADYNTKLEKAFRNSTENKIAVPTRNHKLLHAKLMPPPKPTREQMFDLMEVLENTTVDEQMDKYWALHKTAEYFGSIAVEQTVDYHRQKHLEGHFLSQIGYLSIRAIEGGK